MFTVKNEKELASLLKVITEEAVSFSKKKLNEATDPYQDAYTKRRGEEQKSLFEVEDEEAEAEPAPAEPEAQSEPAEEESQESQDDQEAAPTPSSLGSSLDTLMQSINSVRAGKSLKDSSIASQLQVYYDRLAEEERNVFSLFMRELAKILSGAVDGTSAADPSDPPPKGLDVDIVVKGEEEPEAPEPDPEQSAQSEVPPESEGETPEDPADEEDTSPPIRVNESQDYEYLRKKINKIFLS